MFGVCPTYSPTVDSELPQLDLWALLCTADAALPFTPGRVRKYLLHPCS